jgi:hypothetical protein
MNTPDPAIQAELNRISDEYGLKKRIPGVPKKAIKPQQIDSISERAHKLLEFVQAQPAFEMKRDGDLSYEDIYLSLESLGHTPGRSSLYKQLKMIERMRNDRGYHEQSGLVVLIGWYTWDGPAVSYLDYIALAGQKLFDAYKAANPV